jgi:hypothetical protein
VAQLVEALHYMPGVSQIQFSMGVIEIFRCLNPSGRPMTLGSTQPLTQMSTRDTSWGVKAAGA